MLGSRGQFNLGALVGSHDMGNGRGDELDMAHQAFYTFCERLLGLVVMMLVWESLVGRADSKGPVGPIPRRKAETRR